MSERWWVRIPSEVADAIRSLPPEQKQRVRAALRLLEQDGALGKPLRRELAAYRSISVKPFRIVYNLHGHDVRIRMIDRRETIYELLAQALSAGESGRRYGVPRARRQPQPRRVRRARASTIR